MKWNTNFVVALGLLAAVVLTAGIASAQDRQAYAEACANFQKYSQSKNADDRAYAAKELGNTTFGKYDLQTVNMVLNLLNKEVMQGKKGKNEDNVSGDVLQACLEALQKIRDPKAIASMLKVATKSRTEARVRFYIVSALGSTQGENVHDELVKLLDDKSTMVQIAAMDALVAEKKEENGTFFAKILADSGRPWEMKMAAIQGIEDVAKEKDGKIIEPLLDAFEKLTDNDGRVKVEVMRVLNKLMGTKFTTDQISFWRSAWAAVKAGKNPDETGTTVEPTEFFGLKIKSTRIVFVLDRTGSMEDPGSEPKRKDPPKGAEEGTANGEKEKMKPQDFAARNQATMLREEHNKKKVRTKWDALVKEYVNTIYHLDQRVSFTTIWYEGNVQWWKKELVSATWPNKVDAIKNAEKINPSGGTDIWGAVEKAFMMMDNPRNPGKIEFDKNGNPATIVNGPDTFFVMTDGRPTAGTIREPNLILSEIRKINQTRKVAINTICLGDEGTGQSPPDPAFLKNMAEQNNGQFAHITGK